MPDHADLTETDIKAVLSYIKSETKAQSANAAPFVKPGKLVPDYLPLSIAKNADFFIMYLAAVFILTALLIFAVFL